MAKLMFNKVTESVKETDFDCGIDSINEYIKESYFPSILQQCTTFEVKLDDKVLGYYQILFREIKMEMFPDDISDVTCEIKEDTISSVHIRFIAIDKKYQRKKIGTEIVRVIIKRVEELADFWPIRVITIDAINNLISWYEKEGFVKMKSNSEGQDGFTCAMYFDCIKNRDELTDYLERMTEEA